MNVLWNLIRRKLTDPDGALPQPDPPWKAVSVTFAVLTTAAGFIAWMKDHSPALLLFGASYLGGFFLGWLFRRFMKTAAILAGVFILLLGGLKSTEWIALDWTGIEASITQGLTTFQTGAEDIKQLLMGYLPSAGAGAAGIFFGSRKKKSIAKSCKR